MLVKIKYIFLLLSIQTRNLNLKLYVPPALKQGLVKKSQKFGTHIFSSFHTLVTFVAVLEAAQQQRAI